MSIRSKLLITLIVFGAAAVAGTAWIGYFNAKRSLTEAAMNQLTGIRRSRAYHVESYFRTIRNHAMTLSEDRMFIAAMEEFRDAFRKTDTPQPPEVISAVQNSYRMSSTRNCLCRAVAVRAILPDDEGRHPVSRVEEPFPLEGTGWRLPGPQTTPAFTGSTVRCVKSHTVLVTTT
jgi:hypothetical protein